MSYYVRALLYIVLTCLLPVVSRSQVANFTVDQLTGCVPLVVHFTNTSTGATSYSWDFGNSTGSTLANPSGSSYVTAGTYTVTLTAINGPSSSTRSVVITVYPQPAPNFATLDTAVCPGVPIAFTNTSAAGMAGSMTYSWNFGDGATSTLSAPSHSYPISGFYSITLYATNSGGCTNSTTRSNYIHLFTKPAAGFSSPAPNACMTPAVVPFSNSSTGTAPLTYAWTFGDGTTSTAATPSHTYTLSGSYTAKLAVTNGNGCKDSITRTSYINIGTLAASFASPAAVCAGKTITFTNTSSSHTSSLWRLGTGVTVSDEHPVYTYPAAGTYTAKLIISNGTCQDSTTHTITVNAKPSIDFSITSAQPCPPPITQTFTATMPAGSTAAWDFGDGGSATGNPATHLFTASQITPVTLTVTDANGCVNTAFKIDSINNLVISISASTNQGCAPLPVNFSITKFSSVLNRLTLAMNTYTYPYAVTSYSWDFGDGSPPSTSAGPSHTYTAAGTYVVNCTLTTANGCSKSTSYVIKAGTRPISSFTATPSHACSHRLVTYTSTSTGTPNSYTWNYGDGHSDGGTSPTVSHSYDGPGTYSVSMTAIFNGCPSIVGYSLSIVIDSPGAKPGFTYLCKPFNGLQFQDLSLGATSRLWIFGDGDTTSAANPIHLYPSLGVFVARLTTYNAASGCRDTSSPFSIDLTPVNLSFKAMDTTLCLMQLDTFVANPAMGGLVSEYRWAIDGTPIGGTLYDSLFYSFLTPGYHNVRLATVDNRGCKDTVTKNHYIHVANPLAHYVSTPISGCAPLTVTLSDASTNDAGIAQKSYAWQFGDGNSALVTTPTVSHTYTAAGTYFVQETITDSFQCIATTIGVPITVLKPTAGFSASTTSVCRGLPVLFTNTSSGAVSALWFFGDGTTSSAISPAHAYSTTGTYTVRLVVFNSSGCTDTITYPGYLTVNPVPTAAFTMSDTFAVCPPLNVAFINTSSGATNYNWLFGNGASSVLTNPSNPYTAPGIYTVKLAATNSFGCADTATSGVTVFGYSGAFSYTATAGCSPLTTHFTVTLGSVSSLAWDFGDGYVSSASMTDTISHTYSIPGGYIPKLILTDTSGCTSYSLGSDTVKVNAINPNFTITPNPACENSAVSFSDASYSYFSAVTIRSWAFGGGSTGTGPSASHTYSATGVYTVALTATNAAGCTGTAVKNVTIMTAPTAISGNHPLCAGSTISLSCSPGGGTWYSSSSAIATVSSTGVTTGVAAGTAVITYTSLTGCQATAIVTVNTLPGTITGALQVCRGLTTSLSNLVSGGTWFSSVPAVTSINASGVVTSISAGTTTITYTLPTGCNTWSEVTVNPLPGSISGTTEICIGSLVTLSDPTPSGTWSSSATSVATIGSASGIMTGVSNGTTTITYTLPTGCFATSLTTVNLEPPAITGSLFICAGYSSNLGNPLSGGVWSCSAPPTVAMINPTTGVITGYSPGSVTVSYTVPSGCMATAVATISPLPAPILGTTHVCAGAATTLSDPTPAGTWGSSGPTVATVAPDGVVTSVTAGTATIIYTIPTGCLNVVVVTVYPTPGTIAGTTTVCEGQTTTLASAPAGGTWSSANTLIADIGSASGIVTGVMSGSTLVSYTLPVTGCYVTQPITVNPTPPSITGTATVCTGSSTTLHCTTPGGLWTSSNSATATVDASGIVAGLTNGTVTITYTLPTGGCMAVKNMTVNPPPPVHSVTGGGNYCAGAGGVLIELDGSDVGVSYTLYTGASATGVQMGTGTVLDFGLQTAAGVYTVQATDTSTGCMRDMTGLAAVAITSTVVPTVTVAALVGNTVCAGTLVTFVANSVNGGTAPVYAWKLNGAPVSGGTSYNTHPANGDVITVTLTSNAPCPVPDTAVASLTMTVLPAGTPTVDIVVDPSDTICEFTTVSFTASSAFADTNSYRWAVNDTTAGTGSILSYIPNSGDIIRCSVTSDYVCRLADTALSNAITITTIPKLEPHITVNATPEILPSEEATDTLTTIVTGAGPAPSYQWYVNGVIVPAATTNTYIGQFKNNDSVVCRVLATGLCPDATNSDWVVIKIKQADTPASNIRIYPNPNNGTFTIKGNLADSTAQGAEIEIVNTLGQRLLLGKISASKGRINEVIHMPDSAASGMYLLKIIAGHEMEVFHVSIAR